MEGDERAPWRAGGSPGWRACCGSWQRGAGGSTGHTRWRARPACSCDRGRRRCGRDLRSPLRGHRPRARLRRAGGRRGRGRGDDDADLARVSAGRLHGRRDRRLRGSAARGSVPAGDDRLRSAVGSGEDERRRARNARVARLAVARRRLLARAPLMALALVALFAGLWGGLLRLGLSVPSDLTSAAVVHGPLMTFGFLGTLISLERAVALGRPFVYAA